jgi:succinoglycan biosynthesis protein ExoO
MNNIGYSIDVSVIVATYNVEDYIQKCLLSILNQSKVTVEVIVVDDCSTDSTIQKVKNIDDDRLKLIQFQENRGPSAARNKGIGIANGKWIAIVDGDDFIMNERFIRMIKKADSFSAQMVIDKHSILNEFDEKTIPMFPENIFNSLNMITLQTFINGALEKDGWPLSYSKPIFSRDFLKSNNLRYNESIRIGEDYLFTASALALGALCAVSHNSDYNYLNRTKSISSKINSLEWQKMIDLDLLFKKNFNLDIESLKCLTDRLIFLRLMRDYEILIESIKSKNIIQLVKVLISNPKAILDFHIPIGKRITLLMNHLLNN